ncbi:MAG: c-type cytochrome [Acidobacteriaceae bacterium]
MLPASLRKLRTWFLVPSLAVGCILVAAGFTGIHAAQQTAPPVGTSPVLTPQQQLIHQGKLIFDYTPQYAAQWTGNTLTCTDCHRLSGTVDYASPMIDVAGLFPMFSKRAGHTITLQQRIQECFVRSENGKPMPADSPQMKALVAYMNSLWTNGEKNKPYKYRGLEPIAQLTGNPARGKTIYTAQCAACHQDNGEGVPDAYPPVWGPNSYNDGAGMVHNAKFAAWVQHNMPLQNPGILTPQQAWDVAAYVNSQPRPHFNKAYKSY